MIPKQNDKGEVGLHALIIALIVVVVGVALIPTIVTSTSAAVNSTGASSAAGSILNLMPLFFTLIILAGVLVYVVFDHKRA